MVQTKGELKSKVEATRKVLHELEHDQEQRERELHDLMNEARSWHEMAAAAGRQDDPMVVARLEELDGRRAALIEVIAIFSRSRNLLQDVIIQAESKMMAM